MKTEKESAFCAWTQEKCATTGDLIARLKAEGRVDDANLQKAALNIYAMTGSQAGKAYNEADLMDIWREMCGQWQVAKALAAKHDDYARVAVETIKLAALADIQAAWDSAAAKEADEA